MLATGVTLRVIDVPDVLQRGGKLAALIQPLCQGHQLILVASLNFMCNAERGRNVDMDALLTLLL